MAWTNDGIINHNRKCRKKEEERVGKKENESSLASLHLQCQKIPQVKMFSQELDLCRANAWEDFSVGVCDSSESLRPRLSVSN